VTVILPLEPLAAPGEEAQLARDQLVECRALEAAQVAIEHPAAAGPAREAQKRPVRVDDFPRRQGVGHPRAKLRVVGRHQLGREGVEQLVLRSHNPLPCSRSVTRLVRKHAWRLPVALVPGGER
jgi:hypothetical protein